MIWKPIKGYEGSYEVSDTGLIRSLPKMSGNSFRGTTVLKSRCKSTGYQQVILCDCRGHRTGLVHRLVAEAFIPNPNNLPEVNHKDGNKGNNAVWNLEWCTRSENRQHAYALGLSPSGQKHYRAKMTDDEVQYVRGHYIPRHPIYGGAALAAKFNVRQCTISAIITGRNRKGVVT